MNIPVYGYPDWLKKAPKKAKKVYDSLNWSVKHNIVNEDMARDYYNSKFGDDYTGGYGHHGEM